MQRGALVVIDALGIKGIWKHHKKAKPIVAKFQAIKAQYQDSQRAEFGPGFSALREPANVLKRVRAAFLSDTVVIAVEMKRDVPVPGVEDLIDAAAIVYAARFAGTVMRLGATLSPKWNYRGAISFGRFSMRSGFMIGPAVDSAVERMNLAQGAFVWLTPEAYEVATRKFPSGFGSPWPLTRYAVPLQKDLGALDTLVVSPFDVSSDASGKARLRDDILSGFLGTALDVVVKRQNTARFLEHHLKEFRDQRPDRRDFVLTHGVAGQYILAALGEGDVAVVLPAPPHAPRLPITDADAAVQVIARLPALRGWAETLAQQPGGDVRLGFRIESAPQPRAATGSSERGWRIAAYERHPGHLSNHARFVVDADTGEVSLYDHLKDRRMPYDGTSSPFQWPD